jgi:putative endonuclease
VGSRRARGGEDRQALGRAGEAAAAAYLEARGYRIVARNFRCREGEIDLVARRGSTLAFVEVKTRRGVGRGAPLEAVDARKQQRMVTAAQHFLMTRPARARVLRFDVIGILWCPGAAGPEIEHVERAFEA